MIERTIEMNHDSNYHYFILDKVADKYYFNSNYIPFDKYLAICYETKRYSLIEPEKISKIVHPFKDTNGDIAKQLISGNSFFSDAGKFIFLSHVNKHVGRGLGIKNYFNII